MTQPGYRHRVVIFDRSGSMAKIKAGMESGFSEFIQGEVKRLPANGKLTFSLWDFDDEIRRVRTFTAAEAVAGYRLEPRGMTALYDAEGTAIEQEGRDLAAMPEEERPEDVTVLVVTDGRDNRSRRYTAASINEAITHQQQKYAWRFILLGTSYDVAVEAEATGVSIARSLSYGNSAAGAKGMWASVSSYLARVPVTSAASQAAEAGFNDEERKRAAGGA